MGEEQRRAEGTHLYDLPWLLLVDDDSLGPLLDIDVSRASADPTEWCPALWAGGGLLRPQMDAGLQAHTTGQAARLREKGLSVPRGSDDHSHRS